MSCFLGTVPQIFRCPAQDTSNTKQNSDITFDDKDPIDCAGFDNKPKGLVEIIPAKFRKRYARWKADYLSTWVGRKQWERYTSDSHIALTILVSEEQAEGAIVDDFRWDDNGQLMAATMRLGSKLESGYPNKITYPIISSLAAGGLPPGVKGTILAVTKLAHEFGHLNRMMNFDGKLYQRQNQLILKYNRILIANRFNSSDPDLIKLANEMGGTPVSIQQDREAWAEFNALLYLKERLERQQNLSMPKRVRQAIETYYVAYPARKI
jgi:hypothetical protein